MNKLQYLIGFHCVNIILQNNILVPKKFKPKKLGQKFFEQNFCTKSTNKMLVKSTSGARRSYFTPGMHNIRPAGQMWAAKALNLAREA